LSDSDASNQQFSGDVLDISALRMQSLAKENSHLKQYVTEVMKRLRDNEKLFSRMFKLESQVLGSTDPEDLCFNLLRGLRSEFELDMVRFWFDRSGVVGQCKLSTLSESDLVWIGVEEIEKPGLNRRRIWLLQLSRGDTFDWLEPRDRFLQSLCLMVLGDLSHPIGVIGLGSVDPDRFSPDQSTDFLEHLAQVISLTLENTLVRERLTRIAMTDTLTGTHNRLFFQPHSHQLLSQWFGKGTIVSCLYFDLDNLKKINDTAGHATGDQALTLVSECARAVVRSQDPLIRMGGDEFVLLLPGCDAEKAKQLGLRIIKTCQQKLLGDIALSISMGLSVSTKGEDKVVKILVDEADQAMYVAKALGGSRLEIADMDSSDGE